MERITEASPRSKARMAGLFYVLMALSGGVAFFTYGRLRVAGDAAVTMTNFLAHQFSYGVGFVGYLMLTVCYVVVTLLFYELFKPVNRSLSLLAAFFSLLGCAIQATTCISLLVPFVLLGDTRYSSVFKVEQLQALAGISLRLYGGAFNIAFVFFGFYCLLIGYLIFKSTFLPRILGVVMMLAGLGWLTFLYPPLTNLLDPYIRAAGIGELALLLWLLVKGVNEERWKEQASKVGRW